MSGMDGRPCQDYSRADFEVAALAEFFSGLDASGVRYAVLRNHEALPRSVGSRDIDIVVMPNDLAIVKGVVCAVARKFELLFANHYSDERLTQFVIIRRNASGEVLDLKIDFFTNCQVYGVEAFSAEMMLEDLRLHHGVPVVSDAFVFLDKWIFHVLVGQPLHPKYDQQFADICQRQNDLLQRILSPLLGAVLARDLLAGVASGHGSAMRPLSGLRRAWLLIRMLAVRRGKGVSHAAKFVFHRLRNMARPHGVFLSVSGPDGSGKTTVINQVISQLKTIYGENGVVYQHFRPAALPRIAAIAKATHAIENVDSDYSNPHRANPSGFFGSVARLGYYYVDYLVGYFRSVRPVLLRRQVALFDRYYYDMICDPGRSRIRLPFWILRLAARFLPLPRYAFFICVNAEEIFRRKQELTLARIVELNKNYQALVRSGLLLGIRNEGSPDQAAMTIVDTIVDDRDAKARRELAEYLA